MQPQGSGSVTARSMIGWARLPPVCRTGGGGAGWPLSLRSPDLVASLLACLRLGLTFVPLEPDFPVERLQDRPSGALVGGDLRRRQAGPAFGCPLRTLDGPAAAGAVSWPQVDDALAAYMMFTSGSTGEPKGWSSAGGPCSASSTGSANGSGFHRAATGSLSPPRPSTSPCWRCWGRSGAVAG